MGSRYQGRYQPRSASKYAARVPRSQGGVVVAPVNLWTFPSDLSNAAWTKTNVTISNGGLSARETTANGEHSWNRSITKAAGVAAYSARITFKGVNRTRLSMLAMDGLFANAADGYFIGGVFTAGGTGSPTGSVVDLGGGESDFIFNFNSLAGTTLYVVFYLSDADFNNNYIGVAANGADVRNHRLYAL